MGVYTILSPNRGGAMREIRGITIHDMETPLRSGYALSIARNWFGKSVSRASSNDIIDPTDTVFCVPEGVVSWHSGSGGGNRVFHGIEQAGYARFSRDEWMSPDGIRQMDLVADRCADLIQRNGLPAKWATVEEVRSAVRDGTKCGLHTHDDVRRAVGGTTHTDPTPHYPKDELMSRIHARLHGAPTPTPNGDDMSQADVDAINGWTQRVADVTRSLAREGDAEIQKQVAELRAALAASRLGAFVRDEKSGAVYFVAPGVCRHLRPAEYGPMVKAGVVSVAVDMSRDEIAAMARGLGAEVPVERTDADWATLGDALAAKIERSLSDTAQAPARVDLGAYRVSLERAKA